MEAARQMWRVEELRRKGVVLEDEGEWVVVDVDCGGYLGRCCQAPSIWLLGVMIEMDWIDTFLKQQEVV